MAELRQQVLRGSFYLVGRQALALVVSLAGVTILLRQIGPTSYGLYTGAASIVFVLASVGTFGHVAGDAIGFARRVALSDYTRYTYSVCPDR